MNEANIAYQLSLKSREYIANHDREGWLGMFAEDGVLADPIGPSMVDPDGEGFYTPEAREAFWDTFLANAEIEYVLHDSYTAHLECANIVTLNIVMEMDGQRYRQQVNGIFTYACNAEGKLTALRGYWEIDEAAATLETIAAP